MSELFESFPTLGQAMAYRRRWVKAPEHRGQFKPRVRKRATYRLDLWRVYSGTGTIPDRNMNLGTGRKNRWMK